MRAIHSWNCYTGGVLLVLIVCLISTGSYVSGNESELIVEGSEQNHVHDGEVEMQWLNDAQLVNDMNADSSLAEADSWIEMVQEHEGPKPKAAKLNKPTILPAAATTVDDPSEAAVRAAFELFKSQHKKHYTGKGEARAYANFKKNHLHVATLNHHQAATGVFSTTGKFADVDQAEFKAKYTGQKVPRGKSKGKPVLSEQLKKGLLKTKPSTQTSTGNSLAPPTKSSARRSVKNRQQSEQLQFKAGAAMVEFSQTDTPATVTPSPPSGAGQAGQQAGGAATVAGQVGTQSGKKGGEAGGAGTVSGQAGTQSGKKGGEAGGAGTDAGQAGSQSGKKGGVAGQVGTQSGKKGGVSGEAGTQSGKKGGQSGKKGGVDGQSGSQSGKKGGVDGQDGSQSGKKGGDNSTPVPVVAPREDLPSERVTNQAIGTGGILNITQIAANLKANGASDADIAYALTPGRSLSTFRVNQVAPQGLDCGSCWAWSVIRVLGDMNFLPMMKKLKPGSMIIAPEYSVQYLIDCVKTNITHGCAGGSPMDGFDFLATHPIARASEYPLTPDYKAGECKPPATIASNPIMSWGWSMIIPECTSTGACTQQMIHEIELLRVFEATKTTPVIYVNANNWLHYTQGFFPPDLCSNTMEDGDHLVIIEGFEWSNGLPYWLIANSWGPDWGRFGKIWLPAFSNSCGLANFVIAANQPPPDKADILGWS